MAQLTDSSIKRLLRLISENEEWESLFWHTDLNFLMNCNDMFYWGCADAEDITNESLDELARAFQDSEDHGAALYCARQRGMRPQGAFYSYVDESDWRLFHACGPHRETGPGNPYKVGEYEPYRTPAVPVSRLQALADRIDTSDREIATWEVVHEISALIAEYEESK